VLTVEETLAHRQTIARGLLVPVPKGDGESMRQVASPWKFSASEPVYRHIGSEAGAHTNEVLAEAGYTAEEIAALREQGLFG
jgi:crotonobetainyl-CoA:carnitine CoA-transferase CaiB-like acyl-CoA transferase